MTLYKPDLVSGDKVAMALTNPRHLMPNSVARLGSGEALANLGSQVGADAALQSGSFEDAMLKALDAVNTDQQDSTALMEEMLINPDSVDAHDVTTAMAKANLSLNITRVVLDRMVRGWKEIINAR